MQARNQRTQTYRQQNVTGEVDSKRHRCREALDFPPPRRKTTEENHDTNERDDTHVHPLEALEDLRHLLKEIAILRLLSRSTPFHVDAEHMRQKRQVQMERQPAEEDGKQRHPGEVLDQRGEELLLTQTMAQHREGDVADAREDDDEAEEDAPGLHVEFVDVAVVPADDEVVG